MHTHVPARVAGEQLEQTMGMLLEAGYEGWWGVEHPGHPNEYEEVAWKVAEVQRALARLRQEPESQ
jgi:hypothetical protein